MRRPGPGGLAVDVALLGAIVCVAPSLVFAISVTTPAELHASKGDTVTLPCTFTSTSRPTSKMTVDWSYRPQDGGPPDNFFHFSSKAFLPPNGQFMDRIQWQGNPARGDTSILLVNATLNDNGTYACSVRNPPDVHGSPTSHIVLTVTPKKPSIRFSDVAVLLAFVLLPSAIVTLVLIGRILCPKKRHSQSKSYRSPIEVTEGEETSIHQRGAKLNKDPDDEYEHYTLKKRPSRDEGCAESESRC